MRREPTPFERKLWLALRAKRWNGAKFRRQVVIGGYIVDF
jgi:very-short-patch-repair endonuclease